MIDVLPGLLITFLFLALTSTCKPFCTEGLSRLHALTLVAQFISLFGGLVLIVEDYISSQLATSNESNNTSSQTSIIYALIYLCNGAVVGWPVIQFLLLKSPLEIVEMIQAKIKKLSSGNLNAIISDDSDDSDDSDGDCDGSDDRNVGGDGDGCRGVDVWKEPPAQLEGSALTTLPAGVGAVPTAQHDVTAAVHDAGGVFSAVRTQADTSGEQASMMGELCVRVTQDLGILVLPSTPGLDDVATLAPTSSAQADLEVQGCNNLCAAAPESTPAPASTPATLQSQLVYALSCPQPAPPQEKETLWAGDALELIDNAGGACGVAGGLSSKPPPLVAK
jgi:hypothetical protein